jgi:hypothetical protein
VGSQGSGDGGDGGGSDVPSYARLERLARAVLEWEVASSRDAKATRRKKRSSNSHQYSFWSPLADGEPKLVVTAASQLSEETWRRALLSYKLAHAMAQAGRAASSPKRTAASSKRRPSRSSHRVQMKCGICEAFLGMTEYKVDARGVAFVAVKSVCADCLEDAVRRVATDSSGSVPNSPPVIPGGGKGDGQPRARLQIVRAVAPKTK